MVLSRPARRDREHSEDRRHSLTLGKQETAAVLAALTAVLAAWSTAAHLPASLQRDDQTPVTVGDLLIVGSALALVAAARAHPLGRHLNVAVTTAGWALVAVSVHSGAQPPSALAVLVVLGLGGAALATQAEAGSSAVARAVIRGAAMGAILGLVVMSLVGPQQTDQQGPDRGSAGPAQAPSLEADTEAVGGGDRSQLARDRPRWWLLVAGVSALATMVVIGRRRKSSPTSPLERLAGELGRVGGRGHPATPGQSPRDYAASLEHPSAPGDPSERAAEALEQARYGSFPIDDAQIEVLVRALRRERRRRRLRSWRRALPERSGPGRRRSPWPARPRRPAPR